MAKVTLGTYGSVNLLPIPPESPVREILQWKTDVLESYDSTEERLQVRNHPRQTFRYSLPANNTLSARAFNVTWGGIAALWAVPVWTESQNLGAVTNGAVLLVLNTTEGDFRAGGYALLWQDPETWEVVEVDSLTSADLTPVDAIAQDYTNAFLMPLRIGRVTGAATKSTNGFNSVHQLVFDIEDNTTLSDSAPTQFLGDDVYFDEGLLSGDSLSDSMRKRIELLDPELGLVAFKSPWDNPRITRPFKSILEDRAAVWAFRKWLHRRAGRYVQFWQPSFEADLRLVSTGTLVSSLTTFIDDYLSHAGTKTHIAVETSGGTWYLRTITNAFALDATTMQVDLDSPLNVAASSVLRICYLGLKRLNADQVELNWIGGGVCEVSVSMLELQP